MRERREASVGERGEGGGGGGKGEGHHPGHIPPYIVEPRRAPAPHRRASRRHLAGCGQRAPRWPRGGSQLSRLLPRRCSARRQPRLRRWPAPSRCAARSSRRGPRTGRPPTWERGWRPRETCVGGEGERGGCSAREPLLLTSAHARCARAQRGGAAHLVLQWSWKLYVVGATAPLAPAWGCGGRGCCGGACTLLSRFPERTPATAAPAARRPPATVPRAPLRTGKAV